jgi:formate hydrogenlyase transcriptional activator
MDIAGVVALVTGPITGVLAARAGYTSVQTFAERQGKTIEHIPAHVMTAIERYHWPGNIRELRNFIERSVVLTRGTELEAPVAELTNRRAPDSSPRTLADAERAHMVAALRQTNWVVGGPNGAAARLGLARTTLICKMQKLGVARQRSEHSTSQSDLNAESAPAQFSSTA